MATELTTIDQVKDKLSNYYEIAVSSTQETDADKALANTLKAQLEVISAVKDPTLCRSAFNLLIETLSITKREISDEVVITQTQRRVAYMINSMVFFMDAYLRYQQNKSSAEGQALLKKGCNMLADNANNIMRMCATSGTDVVAAAALFENVVKEVKEGFLTKIFNYFSGKEKLKKQYNDYYSFLDSTITKLNRNKRLLGKQQTISELIYDRVDELVNYKYPIPTRPGIVEKGNLLQELWNPKKSKYIEAVKAAFLLSFGLLGALFIILGIISLINLTSIDLDNASNNMWIAIKYCGIASLAIVPIIVIVPWIAYIFQIIRSSIMRGRTVKYYEEIARQFE